MNLEIIPRKADVPSFDRTAIRVTYLSDARTEYGESTGTPITESVIASLLGKIPTGVDALASLDPNGEDDWMEILSDGHWLALGFSSNGGQENYYSYNADFSGSKENSPLLSGGQSPVEKYLALTDLEAGTAAVEYFLRTGGLYPGIDWAKQL